MNYRRLPLEGMRNVRDLGGFPVSGRGVTRYKVFIRSDSPHRVTEDDIEFLMNYGVAVNIDFRGDPEIKRKPNRLANVSGIRYCRCVTFDSQVAFASQKKREPGRPLMDSFVNWGEKYIEMADNCRDWVRDSLRIMAGTDGGVLFNCATGKDRTGIISALVLSLAGVSREDIIADYCISELYLKELYEELLDAYMKMWPEENASINDPFFKTDPSNMAIFLNHIGDNYDGAEGYLLSCGLEKDELEAIREKLVERG